MVTGIVVAFLDCSPSAWSALVASIALSVLYGIVIYGLRNTTF